ncbi:MAG: hypothetical protein EA401_02360 [Planctomycetota bacterium]|nr:MAG: hypothetical protein EA401_02360 [Planctomycetota bacterium]
MALSQKRLLAWHRWIGLSLALITCAFAVSGLSRTLTKVVHPPQGVHGPREVMTVADGQTALISTQQAIQAAGMADQPLAALRLRSLHGIPHYQIIGAAPARGPAAPAMGDLGINPNVAWVNASSGELLTDGDRQVALAIASRELRQPVIVGQRLDAFDYEYVFIQRLLPVWRIAEADNPSMRITVSTVAGDISSRHPPLAQVDRSLFSLLHKFFFIKNRELREGFAILLCLGILLLGLSALWLSWRVWRRGALLTIRPAARRAHLWLGLLFGGFAVIGAASGILHTVMVYVAERPPRPNPAQALGLPPNLSPPAQLHAAGDVVELDLRQLDGIWLWRQRNIQHQVRWFAADSDAGGDTSEAATAEISGAEERAAILLGERVWGSAVQLQGLQTTFDNDYPFINRFLPVWRARPVNAPGTTLYLSTDLGNLTRKLDPWDRFQARSFSWLHSWKWLPEFIRVPLLLLTSTGIIIMTLSGLWLWRPRWMRRP